ncbi:MAG TPA: glycosyltransferase family 4 protein [Polyangiaceae bacterium]|nr:glycosyltransferase family 4 protein [Polyangiaceae bacterium]
MRVAVVTTSYPLTADSFAGHFVASEAKTLRAEGHEVIVCAPGAPHDRMIDSIRVVTLGGERLFVSPGALPNLRAHPALALDALSFVLRAKRWLHQNGPFEKIQAHWLIPSGWPIANLTGPTRRSTEVECVCHGSDVRLLEAFPGIFQRRVIAQLARPEVRLRCVSHDLKSRLLHIAPTLAAQLTVKPCAIDVEHAPPREQARAELQIPPNEKLVLIVARLIPGKRVDIALSALADFADSGHHSQIRAVVIGDGPQMLQLSRNYPLARFLGAQPRSQTLRWMAAADVLLCASTEEGAPTVVREARALGVPVVCAAAGDVLSWAQRDQGIHVFDSPESIAAIVSEVVSGSPSARVATACDRHLSPLVRE